MPEMDKFTGATIMLGAVTETTSLKETVETLVRICDKDDIKEISVCYSPRTTKESMAVVNELANADYPIKIVAFMQKRPFMLSVADSMDRAQGSHCILLASDMALDLECVNDMIEGAKKSPDTIYSCSRWLPGCRMYGYGKIRYVLNFIAQKFFRILYGAKLTDFTNSMQIAPTNLYQSIKWESEGFPIFLEVVLKPLRLGYKFVEIPTNSYPRTDGKSSNSFSQTAAYLKTAIRIRFMKKEDILKK